MPLASRMETGPWVFGEGFPTAGTNAILFSRSAFHLRQKHTRLTRKWPAPQWEDPRGADPAMVVYDAVRLLDQAVKPLILSGCVSSLFLCS